MTQLAPADRDEFVEKQVNTVLVSDRTTESRLVHLLSTEHWMEPACNTQLPAETTWLDRPVSIYLPTEYPFCPQCIETRFDVDVREVSDHE